MSELNSTYKGLTFCPVCTSYDEYLQDRDEAIWIAELNDGTKVYCDDGRYGGRDRAWNRLRLYLKDYVPPMLFPDGTRNLDKDGNYVTKSRIEKLFIKFRSHTELVASRNENTVGFYFGRAAGAWFGQNTSQFFIIGTIQQINYESRRFPDTIAKTSKWRVPEVIREVDGDEDRDTQNYSENIIWD